MHKFGAHLLFHNYAGNKIFKWKRSGFVRSFVRSFVCSFISSFVRFVHPFICSLFRLFVLWLFYLIIRSFIHSCECHYCLSNAERIRTSCTEAEMVKIWTAGQRIDPSTKSKFVWKPNPNTIIDMVYTDWVGPPDFAGNKESCVHFYSFPDFKWNDNSCNAAHNHIGTLSYKQCPLCEIDLKWFSFNLPDKRDPMTRLIRSNFLLATYVLFSSKRRANWSYIQYI